MEGRTGSARPGGARPVVILLAAALAVRLAWLFANRHLALANDPADYQRLAVSIVSGHGFGRSVLAGGRGPTAFRPPLWPLVLAALYWVVGVHLVAARLFEAILGTLAVGLVGLLAAQMWGRAAGLASMALASVYPGFLLAGGSLLSESLSVPLEVGSLSAALAARRAERPLRWWLLCGGLCGLDILCRTDSAVMLVPVVLLSGRGRAPARLRAGAAVVLAATLTVTPWLVRDRLVMGRFVPLTTQAGFVLAGTYNAQAASDPAHPAAWRPPDLVPGYAGLFHGSEIQEEAALRRAAFGYMAAHPLYPLRVSWWNLLRLFDLTGLSDPRASWGANGYGPAAADLDALGLVVLAGLWCAGAGARLAGRRLETRGPLWPVWLGGVLVVLVTIPLLGESRLRVGIDPFLVLAAAPGLLALARMARPGTPHLGRAEATA